MNWCRIPYLANAIFQPPKMEQQIQQQTFSLKQKWPENNQGLQDHQNCQDMTSYIFSDQILHAWK